MTKIPFGVLAAAALFLFAGSALAESVPSGSKWVLQDLNGATPVLEITLEFGDDGAISGSGGCNRFVGNVDMSDDGQFKPGPLGMTQMACPDIEEENSFAKLFSAVTSADFQEDLLVLSTEDGAVLTFAPVPSN